MTTRRPEFPTIQGQFGLATTRQLLNAGYTRAAVRHQLERRWQAPMPGVLAPHRGPLDSNTRLMAAALWAGKDAVLTGTVALDRYGLPGSDRSEALFLVPESARTRRSGPVRTVRTTRNVKVGLERGRLMIATVERALLDVAVHQQIAARDLKALTLAALQRGLTTSDLLTEELSRAPRRGTTPIRAATDAYSRGSWSLPEATLAELVASDPALPRMLFNPKLTTAEGRIIGTPDAFCPAAGVAVQVHSKAYHSGYDDDGTDLWSLTVEKDAVFTEHDVIVIGVTPRSIDRRPTETLNRIRTVVMRNLGRKYGPVLIDEVPYGLGGDDAGDQPGA